MKKSKLSEEQKKKRRIREQESRDNLSDSYIRKLLNKDWEAPHPEIPEDMIEAYRKIIAIKRVIREN